MSTKTVKQTSQIPTRKVTAGAVIGLPAAVVVVWVLDAFVLPNIGYEGTIPGEVAAAMGSIFSFIASYFVKEKAT